MHRISWEHEREIFRWSLHFKVCGGQLLLIDTSKEKTKCLSVSYDASGLWIWIPWSPIYKLKISYFYKTRLKYISMQEKGYQKAFWLHCIEHKKSCKKTSSFGNHNRIWIYTLVSKGKLFNIDLLKLAILYVLYWTQKLQKLNIHSAFFQVGWY